MQKMKVTIPVGLLFSTSGSYEVVSRAMLRGALLALQEVNESSRYDFYLQAKQQDPEGQVANYLALGEALLTSGNLKHIIGCYTSSSRKEIIPVIEKYDALLWYPSHYEGFETSDSVIYTGAAPNHHVVPLMRYVIENIGKNIYCIGSNYVWAWENNRIVRELAKATRGSVLAERYLQVGDCNVDRIINEINELKPDFVLNTLIGQSSYVFYRELFKAKNTNSSLRSVKIGTCTLCEPELKEIGFEGSAGHISASVYFSTIASETNRKFIARYRRIYGSRSTTSAEAEASYNTVLLLAEAFFRAQSCDPKQVRAALYDIELTAPQGKIKIDKENNHCYLTPRLGISNENYRFDIIDAAESPVRPDPYLVWLNASDWNTNSVDEDSDSSTGARTAVSRQLRIVK